LADAEPTAGGVGFGGAVMLSFVLGTRCSSIDSAWASG
jgi:hypothetical protein